LTDASQEALLLAIDKKKWPRALLVYGNDEAGIAELLFALAQKMASGGDIAKLHVDDLRRDPAKLDELLRSRSFFAERMVVFLSGLTDAHLSTVEMALATVRAPDALVLSAGSLGKTSHVRQLLETAPDCLCCPVYGGSSEQVAERVARVFESRGQKFEPGAWELFLSLHGSQTCLILSDAERLSTFCLGHSTIAVEDVWGFGPSGVFGDGGALADAILGGDLISAEELAQGLDDQEFASSVPLFVAQVGDLAVLRGDADSHGSISNAIRAARPPVFFRRQAVVGRLLKMWSTRDLLDIQREEELALMSARKTPELARELLQRLFLRLSVAAGRKSVS
jgi:DNA polymerase III subunit delta